MTSSFPGNHDNLPSRLGRQGAFVLGTLLLACGATAGEVRVQVAGTQVDLDATAAPLPEVLDRLARTTGMKVVFDGATPRPLITISVRGRSPTQTVLAVLEGLGINYALISDESGIQVQTLLVTGTAAPSASAGRSPSPAFRANRNMPMSPPVDEPLADDALPPDDESVPGGEPEMGNRTPPDEPPGGPTNPAAVPTPPPYTPGPFLPTAPTDVQPLMPFPAPTASPQPGQGPVGLPPSP